MNNQYFVSAAFSSLLSHSRILDKLFEGVDHNTTLPEEKEIVRKNAVEVVDLAILLGEVMTQRYHGGVNETRSEI